MDGFEALDNIQQAQLTRDTGYFCGSGELCRQLDEDDASLDGLLQMMISSGHHGAD